MAYQKHSPDDKSGKRTDALISTLFVQLFGQLDAGELMIGCRPGSPQGSAGSPGTPQATSQPSRDFLRADVTPQEDFKPLSVHPVFVNAGQPSLYIILALVSSAVS